MKNFFILLFLVCCLTQCKEDEIDVPLFCDLTDCGDHGTCNEAEEKCDCEIGWFGETCEMAILEDGFIEFDISYNIVKMVADKERPYIYALEENNNALLIINKSTKLIEKTIEIGMGPIELDIDKNNNTMCIANKLSNTISIIDLNLMELSQSISTPTERLHRVSFWGNDKLLFVDCCQHENLQHYDLVTEEFSNEILKVFQTYSDSWSNVRMATNADKTEMFIVDNYVSREMIAKFKYYIDQPALIEESPEYNVFGLNKEDNSNVVISGDESYIFCNAHKLLYQNMNSDLGIFGEDIYVSNYDGSLVIGQEKIWNGNDFSEILKLPISSTVMTLDPDDQTLYLYHKDSLANRIMFYDLTLLENCISHVLNPSLELICDSTIVLNPLDISANGIGLTWMPTESENVETYSVFHSTNLSEDFTQIAALNSDASPSYTDPNFKFGVRNFYKIIALLDNGETIESNVESGIFEGENIDLGFSIEKMKLDKERPYIYALDKINGNLLFINRTNTNVEKMIYVGANPVDMDISKDNMLLYIVLRYEKKIAVIDLETQEKTDEFSVETQYDDDYLYRIATMGDQYLIVAEEDQTIDVLMIDTETQADHQNIDFASIKEAGLITNSEKDVLFITESGTTGSSIHRLNLVNESLSYDQESTSSTNFETRDACISGNDDYIFYNRYKLNSSDLTPTNDQRFSESIISCTYDGNIAFGQKYIWNTLNFTIIDSMPFSSNLKVLSPDEEILYIYNNSNSKIYLHDMN